MHFLMSTYSNTVLVFEHLEIDLAKPITTAQREGLASVGLSEPFGIVTAFNPHGTNKSAEENAARMSDLESELASSGLDFVRVDGCSADRSHCECSAAVKASLDDVLGIAKRWEQLAIFWWDGKSFWLHDAMADTEPRKLPEVSDE